MPDDLRTNQRLPGKQPEKPTEKPHDKAQVLRARPVAAEIDHAALTREIIAKFPRILAALAK